MKRFLILLLLVPISAVCLNAQENRAFTAEEKAVHVKNVKGIMGKWNTTEIAFKIVEAELKTKQADIEKIYNGLFKNSKWEFIDNGNFSITTIIDDKQSTEKGTFTLNARFLTLYLTGKTYRCLMKIEDDGKIIIHFPIAGQSITGLQLEKQ
jgi:Lipocalin-like domain